MGDERIYWQVNFERFHQHFRDQAIVSAVANKLDQVSVVYYTSVLCKLGQDIVV